MLDFTLKMIRFYTKADEFYTETDEFYTKNDGFYTKHDGFYTKNDEFTGAATARPSSRSYRRLTFKLIPGTETAARRFSWPARRGRPRSLRSY